jgi:hypothetical protein
VGRLSSLRLAPTERKRDARGEIADLLSDARVALDDLDSKLEEVIKGEGQEARTRRWLERQVIAGASRDEVAFAERLIEDLF